MGLPPRYKKTGAIPAVRWGLRSNGGERSKGGHVYLTHLTGCCWPSNPHKEGFTREEKHIYASDRSCLCLCLCLTHTWIFRKSGAFTFVSVWITLIGRVRLLVDISIAFFLSHNYILAQSLSLNICRLYLIFETGIIMIAKHHMSIL